MKTLSLISFSLVRCFTGCREVSGGHGTRIWNMSDEPIEVQIRVGSILKKVHTLKPGWSKRLKAKKIYKAYMPGGRDEADCNKSLLQLYHYDETCHPYIWIHDTASDFSRMVKQQYVSLDDLARFSEIRVLRDHLKGCISVRKRSRPDHFC